MSKFMEYKITLIAVLAFAAVTLTVLVAITSPAAAEPEQGPQAEVMLPSPSPEAEPELLSAEDTELPPVYTVRAHRGYVAVFLQGRSEPLEITDTPISTLRRADQALLMAGVTIVGDENLALFMEDFSY